MATILAPGPTALVLAVSLVAVGHLQGTAAANSIPPAYGDLDTWARDDSFVAHAEISTRSGNTYEASGSDGGPPTERYYRAAQTTCAVFHGLDDPTSDLSGRCAEWERLVAENLECDENSYYLGALYRQTREIGADGTPGEWSEAGDPVADQSCVTPADLADEAARALATLAITPSPIVVQPPNGWTLVNVPTITYTEPGEQMLDTTLLGIPVQIRATPTSYTWDYGDGSGPVTTTDPGAAYPNHTVAHTYEQPADQVTIALTTTWTGQFRITGTPTWTDVAGTATTTSSADPLQVYEARSRLVADDLS